MFKADMHIHTTSSDGLLEPEEVVEWAKKKNIDVIAITDHDSVDGIDRALKAGEKLGIEVIPGLEMSCTHKDEEVHITGLFIDYKNNELKDRLLSLSESRTLRGKQIVDKLNEINIDISYEDVLKEANCGSVGKPHVARVLVKKNIVKDSEEAFSKYLAKDRVADIPRAKISVKEATNLIHNAGGIAILAHPGLIKNKNIPLELIYKGIDGMEVIHSIHTDDTVERIGKIVKEKNLLKSAGSDCHGNLVNGQPIIGDYSLDEEEFNLLKEASVERKKLNAKK